MSEQHISTNAELSLTPEAALETEETNSQLPELASPSVDEAPGEEEEEIEDELIIEDFTIDGICGVY